MINICGPRNADLHPYHGDFIKTDGAKEQLIKNGWNANNINMYQNKGNANHGDTTLNRKGCQSARYASWW